MYIGLLEKMAMERARMEKLVNEAGDISRQVEAAATLVEKYQEENNEEKIEYYVDKIGTLIDRLIEISNEATDLYIQSMR